MNNIDFYTDGAFSPSRNCGGWAVYCPELNLRICGKEKETTINRMELTAVINALEFIIDSNLPYKNINIYSDSMYVVGGLELNWTKNKNEDLWDKVQFLREGLFDKVIKFIHVSGHSDIEGNEVADSLAVKASHLL